MRDEPAVVETNDSPLPLRTITEDEKKRLARYFDGLVSPIFTMRFMTLLVALYQDKEEAEKIYYEILSDAKEFLEAQAPSEASMGSGSAERGGSGESG